MQVKRAPTIPKKPEYLSTNDHHDVNINTPTLANKHYSTISTTQQQGLHNQQNTQGHTPFHSKQVHSSEPSKSFQRKQRPTPTLSIHHLYLYSSSSPVNLLGTHNHASFSPSFVPTGNRQRSSSNLQTPTTQVKPKSEAPPKHPRRPSAPPMASPNGYFKSSHTDQWDFDLLKTPSSQQQQQRNAFKDKFNSAKRTGSDSFESKPMPMDNHSNPTSTTTKTTPLSDYQYSPHTTGSSNHKASSGKYDSIIAHLVDMGFNTSDARQAVESSSDHTLQSSLDILVQNGSKNDGRTSEQQGVNFQRKKAVFEQTTTTKPPAPPPSSSHSTSRHKSGYSKPQLYQSHNIDDEDSSSDEDESFVNDQEWQRQQEARRRDYLNSLKQQQQQQQQQQQKKYASKSTQSSSTASSSPLYSNKPIPTESPSKSYTSQIPSNQSTTAQHPPTTRTSSSTSSTTKFSTSHPTSTPNIPTSQSVGPDIIKKAVKARARGNDLFKLGYYGEAEKSYNQALALLPEKNDVAVVISNNRAAARLKKGQYRQCIMDCTFVIEWARMKSQNESKSTITLLEGDISIRWHDQLGKALHRKAEALEKMVRISEALQVYEELIRMDAGDMKAINGIQRCQSKEVPQPPPRPTPAKSSTTTDTNSSAFPGLDYSIFEIKQVSNNEPPPSKAVAAMRARQAELAKEESERQEKADIVNARIDTWKRGREKNIRALLSSLDTLMWPGAQWRGAPINELLEPKKVKICYMKAIAKVHPDKLPSSTTVEQRLLASGIFSVLNQAWDDFRSNNKI